MTIHIIRNPVMSNAIVGQPSYLCLAIRRIVNQMRERDAWIVENRESRRYQLGRPVTLWKKHSNDKLERIAEAWSNDISYQGVGLLLEHTIDIDSEFFLVIPALNGRGCCIPIKISHCRKLVGHIYQIGGEFLFDREVPDQLL